MNSYGVVPGGESTSHDSGNDIMYNVDTRNGDINVIIEGDEFIIPVEIMDDDKIFEFEDEIPIDILYKILKSKNIHRQFPNLKEGDMVICKNSVRNDEKVSIKGTAREIANYLQALSSCRLYRNGGKISSDGEIRATTEVENVDIVPTSPMPYPKSKKTGIESLQNLVGTDDFKPIMSGVYFSQANEMVATNAMLLVKLSNQKMTNKEKEKVWKLMKGEKIELQGKFPNYDAILNIQTDFHTIEYDIDPLLDFFYGVVVKAKSYNSALKKKERKSFFVKIGIGQNFGYYNASYCYEVLLALKSNGSTKVSFAYYITGSVYAVLKVFSNNNHIGLVMPAYFKGSDSDMVLAQSALYLSLSPEIYQQKASIILEYTKAFSNERKAKKTKKVVSKNQKYVR